VAQHATLMGIKDTLHSAFNALADHTDIAVTVSNGTQSASGISQVTTSSIEQGMGGGRGSSVGAVVVKADEIDKPTHGDTLTIDGSRVYVVASRVDAAGAIRMIEYSETRPAEDADLWP